LVAVSAQCGKSTRNLDSRMHSLSQTTSVQILQASNRGAFCSAAALHGKPSLDQVAKVIPEGSAAEEGVDGSNPVAVRGRHSIDLPHDGAENCSGRKRVRRNEAALDFASSVIAPIMSALAQPVVIKNNTESSRRMTSSATGVILERNVLSRDYATTMKNLLGVEEAHESRLENAEL
jgi:hypothetical protein